MLSFFPATAAAASNMAPADCLLIAVASQGNVGQLALDLMVASASSSSSAQAPSVELLGWVDSEHHVPMAGHELFDRRTGKEGQQPQLCLPLELYGLGSAVEDGDEDGGGQRRWRLVLLQTRAPLLRGRGPAFAEELVAWAKGTGAFGRVVVVAGAAPMLDESVLAPDARLWFRRCDATQEADADNAMRIWKEQFGARDLGNEGNGHVAHAGLASPLLAACAKGGIPAAGLFYFTAEGDNAEDGARLAHVLLESLVLVQEEHAPLPLVAPRSWECLFGRNRRPEMEAF